MSRLEKSVFVFLLICIPILCTAQNFLNEPESVAYDPASNSYLVSNCGDGTIVRIDENGNQSYFSFAFVSNYAVLGLFVQGDTLLAALNGPTPGLAGLDLNTAALLFHIEMPGAQLPNDVTVDRDGIIYVTDCEGDQIYRFIDHEPSVYFTGLNYANGLYYDAQNHSILVATSATPHSIYSIDINDSTLTSLVQPPYRILDGLAMDAERNVYYSSWETNSVYKFDSEFTNPPEVFSADHSGPADICIDPVNNLMCIPNYDANRVDFIPLTTSEVEEDPENPFPVSAVTLKSYPNPFNSETRIVFDLKRPEVTVLSVYDINGKLVEKKEKQYSVAGRNEISLNGSDLASGIYFVALRGASFQKILKIYLLK